MPRITSLTQNNANRSPTAGASRNGGHTLKEIMYIKFSTDFLINIRIYRVRGTNCLDTWYLIIYFLELFDFTLLGVDVKYLVDCTYLISKGKEFVGCKTNHLLRKIIGY